MAREFEVRRATVHDREWIVDLSEHVQATLTAAGSLQQIGPLPIDMVAMSIAGGYAYLLERAGEQGERVGSVLIDPLDGSYPYTRPYPVVDWRLQTLPAPLWLLHALMLDPSVQGKGLGLTFLEGVKQLALPERGSIVLDCWAGNGKLRDFYHRAGFVHHGDFGVKDYEVSVFYFSRLVQ